MKKKISLLLCALILVLGLVGCSGENATFSKTDEGTMKESVEFIISNFSQMQEVDLEQFKSISEFQLDYTMMQTGLKVSGESFVGMINSWQAGEQECGEYISHGDFVIEKTNDGVVVSTLAQYAERDATISFSFDEKLDMKSMDVSAKFSIGEILTKAGLNTLLGMGTVFAVLIFLALLIDWIKYIPMLIDKMLKKNEAPVEEKVVVEDAAVVEQTAVVEETDNLELIAVITAAIAAQEGTSTGGFVVRSIRRRPSNNWI